ncbi:MAG: AAA family ATPase [Myxococcota bacterium]
MPKNLEELVERRVAEWQARRKAKPGPESLPPNVITIARDRGSGGEAVARLLGEILGWNVFDQEIVDAIAKQAHVRNALVEGLDERTRSGIKDTLMPLVESDRFSYSDYLHHLSHVVLAIAHQGNAIIVGRGANFIIPPDMRLAARLSSPLKLRVRRVMELEGLEEAAAEEALHEIDDARLAFARRHFGRDARSPDHYHLVVNAHEMSFEAAAHGIAESFRWWKRSVQKQPTEAP